MLVMSYIFLVIIIVFEVNTDSIPSRTYTMKKDYLNPLFRIGFSIFDATNKSVYRIESKCAWRPKFNLLVLPSKHLIGQSEGKFSFINITLLNEQTNQWVSANITAHSSWWNYEYTLYFNKQEIFIDHKTLPAHTQFHTKSKDGIVLAQSKNRHTTFDIEIYSNDLPDTLYLLSVAWINALTARGRKGK